MQIWYGVIGHVHKSCDRLAIFLSAAVVDHHTLLQPTEFVCTVQKIVACFEVANALKWSAECSDFLVIT